MVNNEVDLSIERVHNMINLAKALIECVKDESVEEDKREMLRAMLLECKLEVDKILSMHGVSNDE